MENFVSLKELAKELGIDRSNLRKYVNKHGFEAIRIRTDDSHNQLALAFSPDEAQAIREHRQRAGYRVNEKRQPLPDNGIGWFYIVKIVPSLAPNRVKMGFTVNVTSRLNSHRTVSPTAELVKAWPCKRTWEAATIDSITRVDCFPISNEVYDCKSTDSLVQRCNKFFEIMPCIEKQP